MDRLAVLCRSRSRSPSVPLSLENLLAGLTAPPPSLPPPHAVVRLGHGCRWGIVRYRHCRRHDARPASGQVVREGRCDVKVGTRGIYQRWCTTTGCHGIGWWVGAVPCLRLSTSTDPQRHHGRHTTLPGGIRPLGWRRTASVGGGRQRVLEVSQWPRNTAPGAQLPPPSSCSSHAARNVVSTSLTAAALHDGGSYHEGAVWQYGRRGWPSDVVIAG